MANLRTNNLSGEQGQNATRGSLGFHGSENSTDYLTIGSAGDFNYLHDVKCNHKSNSHRDDNDDDQYHQLNTFNGRTSLKNIGRVSSLNDITSPFTSRALINCITPMISFS